MPQRVLVIGNGGREASLAWKLAESCQVWALCAHENPSLLRYASDTGGQQLIGNYLSPDEVIDAARSARADFAVVANDDALASGVVDALHKLGLPTVGPTRAGSEIEWNKAYARQLVQAHLPELNPRFWVISDETEADDLFKYLAANRLPVVVKPRGLTGGKGVKVMGAHLTDHGEAHTYCRELLRSGTSPQVVIEEKLEGVEFTVQAITDGSEVVAVPASFDFAFRLDGDEGPGTGGMGSFAGPGKLLPFLTGDEYVTCLDAAKRVVRLLQADNRHFNGVLNVGFFATPDGLRIMEFNARFGDPECMNIMSLLKTPLPNIFEAILCGQLAEKAVDFHAHASVVKYLVAPEYCLEPAREHSFQLDVAAIESQGGNVFFSAARASDSSFVSVGASRVVAIEHRAPTVVEASAAVEAHIQKHFAGPLEHRRDIGAGAYIKQLSTRRTRNPDGP